MIIEPENQTASELAKYASQENLNIPWRRVVELLILYHAGKTTAEVAETVGLSRSRTRYWRRQFRQRGMELFPFHAAEVENLPVDEHPSISSAPPLDNIGLLEQAEFLSPKSILPPGIQPEDQLAEAGRKILRYNFQHMLAHEKGTILGEDVEELHDMRVSTRRMRAAFDVFGEAFNPKILRTHLKGLRQTGRSLGAVRDLDVFIDKAAAYQLTLPEDKQAGLQPFLDSLHARRDEQRKHMHQYLKSNRYREFKTQFEVFVTTPGQGSRAPEEHNLFTSKVRDVTPMLIYTRLTGVRSFESVLENATIEQLHALRIEFKKLRYTIEYFREVLGDESVELIDEIRLIQDHLGNLNDAQVAAQLLHEFMLEWDTYQNQIPVAERTAPEPVINYISSVYAERQRLLLSFKDSWDRFNRPRFRRNLAKAVSVL